MACGLEPDERQLVIGVFKCAKRLAQVVFAVAWITAISLIWIRDVHGPTLVFPLPLDEGRARGYCGPTTERLEDLIVNETLSTAEAKTRLLKHGT